MRLAFPVNRLRHFPPCVEVGMEFYLIIKAVTDYAFTSFRDRLF